jgi:serine/threonine protein kinase
MDLCLLLKTSQATVCREDRAAGQSERRSGQRVASDLRAAGKRSGEHVRRVSAPSLSPSLGPESKGTLGAMLVEPAPAGRRDSGFPEAMGKYVPIARLGSGGMADVFLSVVPGPVGFNKLAVVKRLRNPDEESHVDMFLDEARLAARLNHPNIVHTYDVGETNGKYFIAMEYLEGQTLQALATRLASRSEGLSEPLSAYVAAQALKGLHHAHELCDFDGTPIGVVHRDVSPHNIYITYSGEVKVLDFGIAKAKMNAAHTETGIIKGKVRYMAPEHIAEEDVDRRADVFAVGVVLWEALSRRALFHGDPTAIMARVMNEDAPSARSIQANVSPALDRIALKALRRDRVERYGTADEMRGELEDFLGDKGVRASQKELARLMNELFAQMRDDVRARVRTVLARLPAGGAGSLPPLPDRPSQLPGLLDGTSPRTALATAGTAVLPTEPLSSGRRWRGLLLAVSGAIAAVVLVGRLGRQMEASSPALASPAPATIARAHLRLQTSPPGARVEQTGAPDLLTPAEFDVDPGSRALRITLDGYEPMTIVLDVAPGASLDRLITLQPSALQAPRVAGASGQSTPAGHTAASARSSPPVASGRTPAGRTAPTESPRVKIRVLDDSDSP